MKQQLAYIETFGCQMNERDSEIMAQLLAGAGYQPAAGIDDADLVLLNTCSIRAKAEQKVYSLLGRLQRNKRRKPDLIVTVAGCVAQQEGAKLSERQPLVDIVIGTQNIYRLPELVARVKDRLGPQVAVELANDFAIPRYRGEHGAAGSAPKKRPVFKKFVTIMQGCNNFCTYCVVPHTRGRETSREPEDILGEISSLVEQGIREVTLLGQNVNSYGLTFPATAPHGRVRFPDLLRMVAAVEGLQRIRFTTSHPKDLSDELMGCFAEIDKLCPHFHLPVQAGSDRVLARMNRKYTVGEYLAKVEKLRLLRPDIALTTDLIVGFPGETEEDFEATMALLEAVRYHGAFSFKYSDRPLARSTGFADKVSEQEKSRRLTVLQARQNEITRERNREYEGSVVEVMVEGRSSRSGTGQMSGRTGSNHTVNFEARGLQPGSLVKVNIEEGLMNSLRGVLV